jgi:hypothetical protein
MRLLQKSQQEDLLHSRDARLEAPPIKVALSNETFHIEKEENVRIDDVRWNTVDTKNRRRKTADRRLSKDHRKDIRNNA